MMKILEDSPMPNHRMARGRSASTGIGRNSSIMGSIELKTTAFMPAKMPSGIARSAARKNPASTRQRLAPTLSSRLPLSSSCNPVLATAEGGGRKSGETIPLWEISSQPRRNAPIANILLRRAENFFSRISSCGIFDDLHFECFLGLAVEPQKVEV